MTLEMFAATKARCDTPGPAYYYTQPLDSGPSFSFPRARRRKESLTAVGYFPARSSLSDKGFTIGSRYKEREVEQQPGPDFVPKLEIKKVSIQNRYYRKNVEVTPGPADYDCSETLVNNHPIVISPRGPIKLESDSCSPGPGKYNTSEQFGTGSARTHIRPRTEVRTRRQPNPGFSYNDPEVFGASGRKSAISPIYKSRDTTSDSPGPGYYNPYSQDMPKKTIRTSTTYRRKPDETPGPGAYNIEIKSTRIKPSIGLRTPLPEKDDTPGPDYCPPFIIDTPRKTIGERY